MFTVATAAKSAGPLPLIGSTWSQPDPAIWPGELLPELKRYEQRNPDGGRIFNEQEYGGFLIYNSPTQRIFIDGRCELFGEAFLSKYIEARDNPRIVSEWAEQYRFEAALTQTGSAFDRYFDGAGGWTIVRRTPSATFHVKSADASN